MKREDSRRGGERLSTAGADLRVRSAVEIRALLRRMVEGDIPVVLSGETLPAYSTSLWAEDGDRQVLAFAVDPKADALPRLMDASDLTATAYLDSVKIQFDVDELVLVHGRNGSVLNAAYPRELFRFQRRSSFRVQPLGRGRARASVAHPDLAGGSIDLRILDLSYTGVALMMPEPTAFMRRGLQLPNVMLELDAGTRLNVGLRVSHVSQIETSGALCLRIGCELVDLDLATQRDLQRYIDQTQRRARLLTL